MAPSIAASPSKLRRDRAATTRRKLFEAAANSKEDPIKEMQLKLETLLAAVNSIQSIVFGSVIHVPYFLPYQDYDAEAMANPWGGEPSPTYDPAGPQFVQSCLDPATSGNSVDGGKDVAVELRHRNWLPSQADIFGQEGSSIVHELQGEAATRIQHWFRSYLARCSQDHGSGSYSEIVTCACCGEYFGQNSDDADACDTCGAPLHAGCAHTFYHAIASYRVCDRCAMARRDGGEESVHSDAGTQAENEETLNTIPIGQKLPSEAASTEMVRERGEVNFRPLDDTLDYIIKFVEGEHIKSTRASSETKATIIGHVKAALAWKKFRRSPEEIQKKVQELNEVMTEIVKQL